jgi:hypothetical protein
MSEETHSPQCSWRGMTNESYKREGLVAPTFWIGDRDSQDKRSMIESTNIFNLVEDAKEPWDNRSDHEGEHPRVSFEIS